MTKKDYELIAASLYIAWRSAKSDEERFGVVLARDNILATLQDNKPKFDRNKFLQACGIGSREYPEGIETPAQVARFSELYKGYTNKDYQD